MTPYYVSDYSTQQPDFGTNTGFNPDYNVGVHGYDLSNVKMNGGPSGTLSPPSVNQGGNMTGGLTTGQAVGAASGAAQIGLNAYGMSRQGLNLPRYDNSLQYSPNGRPSYSGDSYITASNARAQKNSWGEVGSAAASGAAAGTAVLPGWGTAIGAVVATGAELIGSHARHVKQQHEKDRAMASAQSYQRLYNTATQGFQENQNAQTDYSRRVNQYNRFKNLYSLPSQYQT